MLSSQHYLIFLVLFDVDMNSFISFYEIFQIPSVFCGHLEIVFKLYDDFRFPSNQMKVLTKNLASIDHFSCIGVIVILNQLLSII